MQVVVFSSKPHDRAFLGAANAGRHQLVFPEARLLSFPNGLVTGHQAFFTREAIPAIAGTTIGNLDNFAASRPSPNALRA